MAQRNLVNSYKEFLNSFLRKRNLEHPEGGPLYEYKISNGRYKVLKVLLKEYWEESEECYACFVLYCVEFLRAESNEGHLRWDYIFDSIGRTSLNMPQARTRIVEKGLKYWKRDIFKGQNREFLETLRFESGLPNSSLHENNNLSSLIKYTFHLAESYKLTEEDLIPFIEERIDKYPIPQVLRQENFFGLVIKLCFKFLELKQRFDLANQSNPTEYLQSQLAGWRAEMPLKIEGDRMNEFFNGIISDISRSKKSEPLALIFSSILKEIDGVFSIITYANIPKGIYSHESFGLSEQDFDRLSGYFSLYLELDGKATFLTGFTKMNNGKISSRGVENIGFPENIHEKEWKLIFASENIEIKVETELSKFQRLDLNDPLAFIKEEDGQWIYKGPAPIKLKEKTCRVVFDENQFCFQYQAQKLGETINGLSVYQVDSHVSLIERESGAILWVRLDQENESVKVLDFAKKIFPELGSFDFLKENQDLSLGFPKVYLLNKVLGLKEFFFGTIEVLNEDKKWDVFNSMVVGRRKFRFKDRNGNIIGVKTLNLLPPDFKVFINLKSKKIELSSSTNYKLFVSRNGIPTETYSKGNSIEIIIDPTFDNSTKTYISLGLSLNSFGIIELKIPNPNFTEAFVNHEQKVVERASYSFSKIYGLSIINNNYSGVAEKKIYKLKLYDIHNREASALEVRKEIWIEAFSTKRQPIYEWAQQINQLFSLTTNTRAKVRISSGTPHHYIEVSKYDFDLVFDGITGLLSVSNSEANQDFPISAFRLDQIFSPKDVVNFMMIDGDCAVLENLPSDGTWFVFSNSGSNTTVIPRVIIKGEKKTIPDEKPIEFLHEASHLDYDQRIARFKEFFDNQYLNFDHPVWKELYDLFKATEHLPISALDVWKGLVKSPKGVLTFFFSEYSDSFLFQKLSLELGFIWHFVSIYRWQEAFQAWYDSMLNSETFLLLSKKYPNYLEDEKSSRLDIIKNELGLYSLSELFGQAPQTINIHLLTFLVASDINGESGRLGIRTRHPEGVYWASYASEFILEKYNHLPEELKSIIPAGLNNWQKPVVYLPVILAYQSTESRFIKINELSPETLLGIKLNMDFDRTYFDDVYSKVQGFCFQKYFNSPKQA